MGVGYFDRPDNQGAKAGNLNNALKQTNTPYVVNIDAGLPMFVLQDLALRTISQNAISLKWSGIYETSVMPHMLIPIIKEGLGITRSSFAVTDKSKRSVRKTTDYRAMVPFIILIALSVPGLIRVICIFTPAQAVGLLILVFWISEPTNWNTWKFYMIAYRACPSLYQETSVSLPICGKILLTELRGHDEFKKDGSTAPSIRKPEEHYG